MKKVITLILFLSSLTNHAQCLAPTNLTYSDTGTNLLDAQLSWTENDNANSWQVFAAPESYIEAGLPINFVIPTSSNPYVFVGLPAGCNAFFVRSYCSPTTFSPWAAIGSTSCSINFYNYLQTLSNESFSLNPDKSSLQIFPNPTKDIVQIKHNSKIDKITILDSLGKEILIQTQKNNELNVENLSKGLYFIEIFTENVKFYRKLVKE